MTKRRSSIVLLLLLVLTATGHGAKRLATDEIAEHRGVALGAALPVLDPIEKPAYGINAALQDEAPEARSRSLDLLHSGGYAWVRQPFPWRDLEPRKGVFEWERWDRLVQDYEQHSLRLVAVLDHPPSWSRQDNAWPNRPPDRFSDFGDFVAAFAAHYRGRVDHLQIWDEPNTFPNWGNRPVDPADYAALLTTAYERAKQANPAAIVILAGLAPNDQVGGRNMSDLSYLAALYHAGAGPYFDVAAAKPYGLWYHPDDRALEPARSNFARVVLWRELMVANDDQTKPIWATEFGWNALPPQWTGSPSPWGSSSDAEQASVTVAAMRRARAEWPWLPMLFLQGYHPATDADDPRVGFDIIDSFGRPRPVYEAVRDFVLSGPDANVGFQSAAAISARLSGPWQFNDTRLVGSPGATLQLRFSGTRLDLLVAKEPTGTLATVAVDGGPAKRLLKVGGEAWLDGRALRTSVERVIIADGLTFGQHELVISIEPRQSLWPRNADGGSSFAIAGLFVVREQAPSLRFWLSLGLGLVALVVLGLLLAIILPPSWRAVSTLATRVNWGWPFAIAARVRLRWHRLPAAQKDIVACAAIACVLGALYVSPYALPLLLAPLIIFWRRPVTGAFALIVSAPFGRMPVQVGGAQFTPLEIVAVLAVVALLGRWLCRSATLRSLLFLRPGDLSFIVLRQASRGFNAPIALFMVASTVATLLALDQRLAVRELRTAILEPFVIYAVVIVAASSRQRKQQSPADFAAWLVDLLVIVGVAVAVIGLYQYLFSNDVITAEGVRRLRSVYGSPNNVGLFLGRIIPLAVCIAAGDRRRRWYFAALVPLLVAAMLSFSVGAWLGIAVAILLVAALQGTRLVAAAAAVGTAGGLAVAFVLLPLQRLQAHLSLDQGTTRLRLLLWRGALDMLRDHPLFGVGPDNFLQHYRTRYILPDAWQEPNLSHPHNLLLDFALRTGLAGLAAGVWLLVLFFVRALDLSRRLADPMRRALVLGLIASMIDCVAHGLVDNSIFLADLALVFWLSLALLEVLRQEHYNRAV